MHIEKLPSGKFRVKKQIDGYRFNLFFDERPTQKEVKKKLEELTYSQKCNEYRTFEECAKSYIWSKSDILSANTIYSYEKMLNVISPQFKRIRLVEITQFDIQIFINQYSKKHKPKSVKNIFIFIMSVIKMFNKKFDANITIPQQIKSDRYTPTDKDIENMLNLLKGTDEEIPFLLACYGLRRGEIMALEIKDIEDGKINIRKSMYYDYKTKTYKTKSTKTKNSTRTIYIEKWITDLIFEKGTIYNKALSRPSKVLKRIQEKNNLPIFSLHSLRHYFASTMHRLGVPEKFTEHQGGWEHKSNVLHEVYTDTNSDEYNNVLGSTIKRLYFGKK